MMMKPTTEMIGEIDSEWNGVDLADGLEPPEGWFLCYLDEHVYIAGRIGWRGLKAEEYTASGPVLLSVPNLNHGDIVDFSKVNHISHDRYEESPEIKLKEGDTLLVKDGAGIGKLGFVQNLPNDATVNSSLLVVRPQDELLIHKYLFYYLKGPQFQQVALQRITGSATPHLFQKDIKRLRILLAPPAEQQRIIAKLESSLSAVTATCDHLSRVPAILKQFRQAVLAAACSGRLTEDWRSNQRNVETADQLVARISSQRLTIDRTSAIREVDDSSLPTVPDEWTWAYLSDLGHMSRGKSRHRPRDAKHLYNGPYPFIQTGDIAQSAGRIVAHQQTYSEAGLQQSRLWPAGTVCVTIAANIAHSAILTYPACFPDSVVGIISDANLCFKEYLEFFIRTARADLEQYAPATAQKNINIAILNDLAVPLPPQQEQREIIRRTEALLNYADAIQSHLSHATIHVNKLTQSILAKAFRGELVPTEAELARREGRGYEPASVLLERIKREREEQTSSKPKQQRRRPKAELAAVKG